MAEIINEVCGNESSKPKNLGGKDQCLEKAVKTLFLAKDTFSFASLTAFKSKTNWDTAIAAKDIVPLPNVENPEENNTEAVIKNGAHRDYTIKDAIPGSNYRIDAAICTYEALKTYQNSDYKRVFEVTFAEEVTADVADDGKVFGRKITSLNVPLRARATAEDVPFTSVNVKFADDVFSILKTDFEPSELEGIYDVVISQVSASATEIKVKVTTHCTGAMVTSLESGDLIVKDDTGATESTTFTAADANGVYTLTGTGFTTGFTVELDGIVTKGDFHYEDVKPLSITI